jgi:hypothetical protein
MEQDTVQSGSDHVPAWRQPAVARADQQNIFRSDKVKI